MENSSGFVSSQQSIACALMFSLYCWSGNLPAPEVPRLFIQQDSQDQQQGGHRHTPSRGNGSELGSGSSPASPAQRTSPDHNLDKER